MSADTGSTYVEFRYQLLKQVLGELAANTANTSDIATAVSSLVAGVMGIPETSAAVAASSTAQTIPDPSVNVINKITLTAACTLTFPTAAAGKKFRLVLIQGGSGSYTITWPSTAKWAGSTAPTLSTSVGKVDVITFICYDGTNWMGQTVLDVR